MSILFALDSIIIFHLHIQCDAAALLSKTAVDTIEPLTDKERINAFVVDDSLFERTSCKKTELGSRVFDHTTKRYRQGFRLMTLGWTDGNTFLPINSCLLASSKEANLIGPREHYDGRSLAAKRRKLAQMKGTNAMIELLKTAQTTGHQADYVLFDTWFSNPAQLIAVHNLGLDSIAMIKKRARIYYEYDGKRLSINKIFGVCKKRRGRSKYLLSVNVMVGKDQKIPAKIVCVRNKKKKKDWIAFISTDTSLSEEEIIRIYGKRWKIEVFFKTCKSYMKPLPQNISVLCHPMHPCYYPGYMYTYYLRASTFAIFLLYKISAKAYLSMDIPSAHLSVCLSVKIVSSLFYTVKCFSLKHK